MYAFILLWFVNFVLNLQQFCYCSHQKLPYKKRNQKAWAYVKRQLKDGVVRIHTTRSNVHGEEAPVLCCYVSIKEFYCVLKANDQIKSTNKIQCIR